MKKLDIDWVAILVAACKSVEDQYDIKLDIDTDLIKELDDYIEYSLASYDMDSPNAAKVAGHVCFWLRRFKPITHESSSRAKYFAVNEEVALFVGLSICDQYFDDHRAETFNIDMRVLKDWVSSLRYNSHSPHALALSFELLTGRTTTQG